MDDLLADFIAETREMLDASSSELVAWEADPTDRARLDTIFRFVHTVKGNCGFFDFPALERLSHGAEDALSECRAGRRDADHALVSAVLAIIDRISEMSDAIERGEPIADGSARDTALLAALDADGPMVEPSASLAQIAEPVDVPAGDGAVKTVSPVKTAPNVQRSIRLPVDLLDEVMKGVSDMVLARNDLARRLREAGEQPAIDGPFERLSTILTDVRSSITRMRMQQLDHLFGSLPRLVRDLSHELGKQVLVDCEGGDVELDREMIEMVRDPLTHIIRNAIDHGIEPPAARLAAGKREIGLLRFSARQSGNQILLVVSDDGRGLDTEKLAAKAQASGSYSATALARMTAEQKQQLIFEPGLSTADAVSSISGRGVGMDVVRANIEKVGGSISVGSKPGEGTVIELKLPLTLSIIAALTVRSGGQTYALPQSYVEEIAFGSSDNLEFAEAGDRTLVTFRGRRVPCLSLGQVLGEEEPDAAEWRSKTLALLRLANNEVFALAVDAVLDHEDVVIKPIAPAIMNTRLYAGTTLLDDGRPMMLLDIPSIASRHDLATELRTRDVLEPEEKVHIRPAIPLMLFTALDGSRRVVRLDLVRRIDTVAASDLTVTPAAAQAVIDGRIVPLEGHRGGTLPQDVCRLLRLSDGDMDVAYVVREVLDTVEMTGTLSPAPGDPEIKGTVLLNGEIVAMIDGHRLFARNASARPRPGALTCQLSEDSDWSQKLLRPLLETAGYTVVSETEGEVDLAFRVSSAAAPAGARHIIELSDDPAHAGGDTIYRYDREGLLAALQRVRQGKAA